MRSNWNVTLAVLMYFLNSRVHGYASGLKETLNMVPSRQRRDASNASQDISKVNDKYCAFSSTTSNHTQPCSFLLNVTRLGLEPWMLNVGSEAHWHGGPDQDGRGDTTSSGYAMGQTSQMISKNSSVWMVTDLFNSTGPDGKCLSFKYSIDGLNAKGIEALLIHYDDFTFCAHSNVSHDCHNGSVTKTQHFESIKLWSTEDTTESAWYNARVTFSRAKSYHVAIVGHATAQFPDHRGFLAIDDVSIASGPCSNDCLFDKDFCQWTVETGSFPWQILQSSNKLGHGPSRDQSSSVHKDINTGSYAYIENAFPRRGGDKAVLTSPKFPASNSPVCFRFWTQMHGLNVGVLRVFMQNITDGQRTEVWSKEASSGEVGWSPGQVTLSTNGAHHFNVSIEAEIKQPATGGIALDTLHFQQGSCPVLPHTSGKGMSVLDCSFDVGSCSWTWIQPHSLTSTFLAMVLKVSGADRKLDGHSWRPSDHPDSYVLFDFSSYKHRVRDSGYLVSPTLLGRNDDLCLSFWAYMNSNVYTDPIVGAISVIMRLSEKNITVWRLANKQYSNWFHAKVPIKAGQPFQLMIKATKGSKRGGVIAIDDIVFYPHKCQVEPAEAKTWVQDCCFDDNACGWMVESQSANGNRPSIEKGWRFTGQTFGLTVVYDHTYAADNAGYVYLESFNEEVLSSLVSPYFEMNTTVCLTFSFVALSKDDSASLTVYRRNKTNSMLPLWKTTQKQLPSGPLRNVQAHWNYAQVSFFTEKSQLLIESHVKTGGWAIDDIRVLDGPCITVPKSAAPTVTKAYQQTNTPLKLSKVPSPEDLKTETPSPKPVPAAPTMATEAVVPKVGPVAGSGAVPAPIQQQSQSRQIKTAPDQSVLIPRTEIEGPSYPGFEKTSFDLPGAKKSRLGRSVSEGIMHRLVYRLFR